MSNYKLVPVEPTAAMESEGMLSLCGSIGGYESGLVQKCWHAMLAAAPAVQGEPVGYVSQDFLDGKWNMDHIVKSDEGQISRTIPVFAKPPQPTEQQPAPNVSGLVEALEEIDAWVSRWCADDHPVAKSARNALAAHRKQQEQSND